MRRNVVAVAVSAVLLLGMVLLATGLPASAAAVPVPPALIYGAQVSALMPDGCVAAPPTISVVSGFGPNSVLATKATITDVTCTADSGYTVSGSEVTVQFLGALHVWAALSLNQALITPTTATFPCVTVAKKCVPSLQYRRGLATYTLTEVSTGVPIVVHQVSLVQAPLATPRIATRDLIARDTTGGLWLYPGDGTGGSLAPRQIGHGWGGFATIVGPGDVTSDHHVDLIATDAAGGLWLYPGNGTGGFLAGRQIGRGWSAFTALVAAGDFDGDAHPDLIGRDSTGVLWLYPGNGGGGFLARRQIGQGWNAFSLLVGSADYTGDGHPDLIGRDALGNAQLYPGNGRGGFLAHRQIDTGWNFYNEVVGVGDFDGVSSHYADLIARTNFGGLRLYEGTGTGVFGKLSPLGTGWNDLTELVGPGNFDG